jgi:hypothetical protein
MISKLSLAQYVKKRNGVPLGASGSMTKALNKTGIFVSRMEKTK